MNKENVKTAANIGGHTISLGLIAFLLTHFPTRNEYTAHCHQCEVANTALEKRVSETWQATMDNRVELARMGRVELDQPTNGLTAALTRPAE